jgi:hypothetical protein
VNDVEPLYLDLDARGAFGLKGIRGLFEPWLTEDELGLLFSLKLS